ncbi:MAG: hypothetical protein EKK42_33555 [Pseudonocardiaceae bacterium]|nr:MAG: hypothetical protein EKK42_33555 [Pseudonocardiaceae bacterium]
MPGGSSLSDQGEVRAGLRDAPAGSGGHRRRVVRAGQAGGGRCLDHRVEPGAEPDQPAQQLDRRHQGRPAGLQRDQLGARQSFVQAAAALHQ